MERLNPVDIKIIIATHKKYWLPKDSIYLPLQVGAEGKKDLGYVKDNIGDNISAKNANFCELTGLYWAWKNLDADYVGLVHYRRYFTRKEVHNIEKKKTKSLRKRIGKTYCPAIPLSSLINANTTSRVTGPIITMPIILRALL